MKKRITIELIFDTEESTVPYWRYENELHDLVSDITKDRTTCVLHIDSVKAEDVKGEENGRQHQET